MNHTTRRSLAFASVLAAFATFSVSAQPARPNYRVITHYTIKADRVGDFLAATKDYAAAVQKGGSDRSLGVWVSLSGPREYLTVTHIQKLGDLDTGQDPKLKDMAAQLTTITNRIFGTVESSHRVIAALDHELSLPFDGGVPQPMVRVLRTWVRPDQLEAYRSLLKSDLVPAAKKAGLRLFSYSRVRFGGSGYEFNSAMGIDNWAAMDGDGPIVTAMGGDAAYQRFLAKLRPMIVRSEYEVYRYQKDSSYIAPAK